MFWMTCLDASRPLPQTSSSDICPVMLIKLYYLSLDSPFCTDCENKKAFKIRGPSSALSCVQGAFICFTHSLTPPGHLKSEEFAT